MTNKRGFYIAIFSCALFALPSINLLDIFPDFLGYFLLAALLSRGCELVPHLSEARSAAVKLGFVTLARIPATVIMYANMYTGRDIVPLFTLVFAVIEAVLLYMLISNAFAGLFYIAERTDASKILVGVRLFSREISPEGVKNFTVVFAFLRAILNVLPEFCLLSSESEAINKVMAILYPILLISSLVFSLIVGVIWLILAYKYALSISQGREIADEVRIMAGDAKLESLKVKKRTSQLTGTLTLLALSSILTLDVTLRETGGVNILPRFIYSLVLLYCAVRLFSSRKRKAALAVFTAGFTVSGLILHILTVNFFDSYTLYDLLGSAEAQAAYMPIKILAALESASLIIISVLMAMGMRSFILKNTGIEITEAAYSRADRDRHRSLILRSNIMFIAVCIIAALKCAKVFIDAGVKTLFTQTGMIVTSSAPWLLWVCVGLSLALTLYAFFTLSAVSSEVKFKYATEEEDKRKGRFE